MISMISALLSSCGPVLSIENPFESSQATTGQATTGDVSPQNPLRIYILDVGQGDSTLIVGPSGRTLLIDAGRNGEGIGTVLPHLAALSVNHLNWIVATHYDADHIGGLPEVLKGADQIVGTDDDFIPTTALVDRGDATEKSTAIYRDYAAAAEPYRQEATPGMRWDLGGGAHADVIVVNGRYSDGRSIHLNPDEENESCIGLLIQYRGFRYFTAGDLTGGGAPGGYETKDMETIAGEIIGDIDILHVGHHGSETSSNERFLGTVASEAAVISAGADNDYGHPTASTLQRLEDVKSVIYRTDESGGLVIETRGTDFEIRPIEKY
jgi:beta-lactamase superfamily II metal-dependent hydrolase